jgi:hypothetical protein
MKWLRVEIRRRNRKHNFHEIPLDRRLEFRMSKFLQPKLHQPARSEPYRVYIVGMFQLYFPSV